MLLLVKDTKFESKSQPSTLSKKRSINCFYWSKIQNLKANHNLCDGFGCLGFIAFTGQRYKIWKQITTIGQSRWCFCQLLLLVKDTKFESKSQQVWRPSFQRHHCFYWSKIQNLKANHNVTTSTPHLCSIAFTGQRYKIWKQITTTEERERARLDCFYWSKIQNLKANHNYNVVEFVDVHIAFTGQRYKIWKQITTIRYHVCNQQRLLLLVKDTKFESKSQLFA